MRRFLRNARLARLLACLALALPLAIAPHSGRASDNTALFDALRAADMQLATIGWRLATANVSLCDRLEPGTGIQLHTLDQFDASNRDEARGYFHFDTPVAIEGIVTGSPAELAGLRANDSLVRIGGIDIAAGQGKPGTTERLVSTQLAIAALPADAPIEIDALRNGARVHATIQPLRACKSRFELRVAPDYNASADGTMVQISSSFIETYSDDELAAVVAHEFSHNVLHHRDRLEARGVDFGMLSGFGANVKYFRQTEIQADLLSVYLIANAGYPPQASIAFWKHFGPSKAGGIFRSRSHPAWRDRVATIEAEIAKFPTISARPMMSPLIAERDQPLNGDWQSLLVRAK